jgi:hypothetical protein
MIDPIGAGAPERRRSRPWWANAVRQSGRPQGRSVAPSARCRLASPPLRSALIGGPVRQLARNHGAPTPIRPIHGLGQMSARADFVDMQFWQNAVCRRPSASFRSGAASASPGGASARAAIGHRDHPVLRSTAPSPDGPRCERAVGPRDDGGKPIALPPQVFRYSGFICAIRMGTGGTWAADGVVGTSDKLYYGHPGDEQAECYSTDSDIGVHALFPASLRPDRKNAR